MVDAALTPGDDAIIVMPDGTERTVGEETGGDLSGSGTRRVIALAGSPVGVETAALAEDRRWVLDVLKEAKRTIAVNLGRDFSVPWILWMNDETPQGPLATALAYAFPSLLPEAVRTLFEFGCQIHVNPNLRTDPSFDETAVRGALAHEMFHCFQFATLGWKIPGAVGVPNWVTEGQATWVGEAVVGGSTIGRDWWATYLVSPNQSLWSRSYDAVGFFFHMQELGFAPWLHVDAMLHASDNPERFRAARAHEDDFLDTWASGLLRKPILVGGPDWNAVALYETTMGAPTDQITLSVGSSSPVLAGVVRNAVYLVRSQAEVVEVRIAGHARLHTGSTGGDLIDGLEQTWLCTKPGGCACPEGEGFSGPPLVDVDPGFFLALTGGLAGAEGTLTGHALDEFCEPRESPPPPDNSAPCTGGGCASSAGEPHMRTVDGVGYDFMAAGEYVLLRSPDGALEIQARQEPIPGSAHVTVNTAIAARVGASRVVISTDPDANSPLSVAVDGQPVDASTPIELGDGGRVAAYSGGVQVDFPDGTQLWAVSISGGCCINVMIAPTDALITDGAGLLGNVAPGTMRVPAMPDGTRLTPPVDEHERYVSLYQVLGPAWAVTDETTLFDYEDGQSTQSFVIPGFPEESQVRTLEDLTAEERAQAEALCGPVEDQDRFLECVFDVSITDLLELIELYVSTVDFETQGPVAIGAPPPQPPPPPPDDLPEGFHVVTSGVDRVVDTEVAADGRLYTSVAKPGGKSAVLAIDTASGVLLGERELELVGQVEVAGDSIWVGAYQNGFECIIVRLEPGTLAERAVIEVPCDIGGAQFAALGDTVWFLDRTTADIDARNGDLRRIDPATNAPAESVKVGFVNGELLSSDSALFWRADTNDQTSPGFGVFRLVEGATELESLGPPLSLPLFPGGNGLWAQLDSSAVYWSTPAGPDVALPIIGSVVGGDSSAVYVAGSEDELPHLLRYGSAGDPVELVASSIQLDTSAGPRSLDYGVDAPLAVGGGLVAQLWLLPSSQDPEIMDLVMQAVPAP